MKWLRINEALPRYWDTGRRWKSSLSSSGWKAGVDGSVALITVGVGGTIDTTKIKDPIVGFVFGKIYISNIHFSLET